MKNINSVKWLFSCILFFCLCVSINAVTFDCKHLYIGGQNGRANNYAEVTVHGPESFSGVDFRVNPQHENPTLALGPYQGEIVLYWWDYNMYTSANSGTGVSSPIYYVRSNSQVSSPIPQSPSSIKLASQRLSGGTVNQKTGEIYLLTEPCSSTRSISILKPNRYGTFYLSNKSPNLDYTQNSACRAFSSDMAIDADGNAYLLVNIVDNKNYDKSDSGYKLIKVNPQDWSYDSIMLQNDIMIDSHYAWGMAFLNGKLYVATSNTTAVIHTIDPIRGGASFYGNVIMQNGKKYGYGIDDMASCQTATAITGKVYLDKNGDGKIDNSDKTNGKYQFVPNITVEIYNAPAGTLIGSQRTNSFGEYNFLVELNKAYYIRIKQPQIYDANTHQTWASGGEFSWQSTIGIGSNGANVVTPICHNTDAPIYEAEQRQTWYSGNEVKKRYTKPCYGAKANGIDSSSSIILGANYYTHVFMRTDLSVAHADFAIANVDRSDAPSNFGEVSHSVLKNSMKMGDLIDVDTRSFASSNADGDDNNNQKDEDGVEVKVDDGTSGGWKSLKNFKFNNNKYLFRVKVNEKGFLNAWVNINRNYVNLNNFASGAKIADNIKYDNNTGYIIFPADIDTKIATDGGYINGSKVSKLHNLFFRFRYSSYNASMYNIALAPANPPKGNSLANSQPWAIDGEVEDYKASYQYIEQMEPKGRLIIVNQNFNLKAGDKKSLNPKDPLFALYTQIANKPFDVKMVYYDESGSGVAKALESPNLLVKVDLVDFNDNCESSPVVQNIYKGNISAPVNKLSNIKVNAAIKNAAFKATYGFPGGNKNKTICSPDTFAVRPESFILEGNFNGKLIGGSNNGGKIKAIESGGKNSTRRYNQQGVNIISDAALVVPSGCPLSSNASSDFHASVKNFIDGNADIDVKYQNVGKINISLTDKEWTSIDVGKGDCIANNAINTHNAKGIVGCDTTMNKEISFIPNNFDVNIKMGNANDASFTYLSNSSVMSAYAETTIKAMLADKNIATNYHKNCFADNITYDISLINNNLTGWDNRKGKTPMERIIFFPGYNAAIVKNNMSGGTSTFETKQENFNAGEANNIKFKFNFGRLVTEAENPFKLNSSLDFNITNIRDAAVSDAVINIENNNITFFYGRIFSNDYEGESPIPAKIIYEVYCAAGCIKNEYDIDIVLVNLEESRWFLNNKHNSASGDIISYAAKGMSLIEYPTPSSNGKSVMSIINNSKHTPYQDVIYVSPDSWLIYNRKNENARGISFTVKFIGNPSIEWAGKGGVNSSNDANASIGKTIDAMPSQKMGGKIDW
jgi:hypothetical protein